MHWRLDGANTGVFKVLESWKFKIQKINSLVICSFNGYQYNDIFLKSNNKVEYLGEDVREQGINWNVKLSKRYCNGIKSI